MVQPLIVVFVPVNHPHHPCLCDKLYTHWGAHTKRHESKWGPCGEKEFQWKWERVERGEWRSEYYQNSFYEYMKLWRREHYRSSLYQYMKQLTKVQKWKIELRNIIQIFPPPKRTTIIIITIIIATTITYPCSSINLHSHLQKCVFIWPASPSVTLYKWHLKHPALSSIFCYLRKKKKHTCCTLTCSQLTWSEIFETHMNKENQPNRKDIINPIAQVSTPSFA